MNVTINILECCSELADLAVRREIWGVEDLTAFMDTDTQWKEIYQKVKFVNGDEATSYTEKAQDCFNRWYDYYFDIIINLSEDGKD